MPLVVARSSEHDASAGAEGLVECAIRSDACDIGIEPSALAGRPGEIAVIGAGPPDKEVAPLCVADHVILLFLV